MRLFSVALKGWSANGEQDHLIKWIKAPSRAAVEKFLKTNNLVMQEDEAIDDLTKCDHVIKTLADGLDVILNEEGEITVGTLGNCESLPTEVKSEPEWTKKDGSKIKIKDMTDGHLVNTLRLVQRRLIRLAAEHNFDRMLFVMHHSIVKAGKSIVEETQSGLAIWKTMQHMIPAFGPLATEADRRNLNWKPSEEYVAKYQTFLEVREFLAHTKENETEAQCKAIDEIFAEVDRSETQAGNS